MPAPGSGGEDAAPKALIDELNRKGIAHEGVLNAYAALARVCCRTDLGEVRVLIFVEPGKLGWSGPMFRSFLSSLDRFAPEAARWVYEPGAALALRALTPEDIDRICGPAAFRDATVARGPAAGMSPRMERRPSIGAGFGHTAPGAAVGGGTGGVRGEKRGVGGGQGLRLVDATASGGPERLDARAEPQKATGGEPGDELGQREDVSTRAGHLTHEELSMLLGDDFTGPPIGSPEGPPDGNGAGPASGGKGKGFTLFGRRGREGPGGKPGSE